MCDMTHPQLACHMSRDVRSHAHDSIIHVKWRLDWRTARLVDSWRALSNLTPRCQKFARDRNSDLRPDVGSEIGHLKIGRLNFLMKRTVSQPIFDPFSPSRTPTRLFLPLSGEIGCLQTSNRARGLNERTSGRPVSKKTSSVAKKTSYLSLRVNWAISPIPQKLGTGKTPHGQEKTPRSAKTPAHSPGVRRCRSSAARPTCIFLQLWVCRASTCPTPTESGSVGQKPSAAARPTWIYLQTYICV